MEEMLKEVQYCQKIIKTKFKKPLKMSSEDEQNFNAAKVWGAVCKKNDLA